MFSLYNNYILLCVDNISEMEIGDVRVQGQGQGQGHGQIARTSYYYEVVCNACRIKTQKGNRLEATVAMINHAKEKQHEKCDWLNLLQTTIIQMFWNSPEAGHSELTIDEILEFMGIMAKDQDIPYEDFVRFSTNKERNGA